MNKAKVCIVSEEKLSNLISSQIAIYQAIDDFRMMLELSLKSRERARKTEVRFLTDSLNDECISILEGIGMKFDDIVEDDEDAMFDGALNALDCAEMPETNCADCELGGILDKISELIVSDKPISITADIHFNTSNE